MINKIEAILLKKLMIVDNSDMFPNTKPVICNANEVAQEIVKLFTIHDVTNIVNCQHEKGRRTSVTSDYWKCSKCGEIFKGN